MKYTPFSRLLAAATLAVSLLIAPTLKADPLLSAAYEAQLEAWLGQGNLDFTNVFTKTQGATSYDFHAAADGQGATFTILKAYGRDGSYQLPTQVIGGYNPQSWNSSGSYNNTFNYADRTAFIYNLTSNVIQRQQLGNIGLGYGFAQTYNSSNDGPAFGAGHDLSVDQDLSFGSSLNISYGPGSFGAEIVFGPPNFADYYKYFVSDLEVYTFARSSSTVPDSAGTLGLLSVSLLALAAFRRRVT